MRRRWPDQRLEGRRLMGFHGKVACLAFGAVVVVILLAMAGVL